MRLILLKKSTTCTANQSLLSSPGGNFTAWNRRKKDHYRLYKWLAKSVPLWGWCQSLKRPGLACEANTWGCLVETCQCHEIKWQVHERLEVILTFSWAWKSFLCRKRNWNWLQSSWLPRARLRITECSDDSPLFTHSDMHSLTNEDRVDASSSMNCLVKSQTCHLEHDEDPVRCLNNHQRFWT